MRKERGAIRAKKCGSGGTKFEVEKWGEDRGKWVKMKGGSTNLDLKSKSSERVEVRKR